MSTLNKENRAARSISPEDVGPEDVIAIWLWKRIRELPKDSLKDMAVLIETVTNQETPAEEYSDIYKTMREILFPQLVGDVHVGMADLVQDRPIQVEKRAEYVGKQIKAKREEKGMTQMELAKASGLPQSHICRLENGEHSPSFKTLEKIANALSVTVGDLDPSN